MSDSHAGLHSDVQIAIDYNITLLYQIHKSTILCLRYINYTTTLLHVSAEISNVLYYEIYTCEKLTCNSSLLHVVSSISGLSSQPGQQEMNAGWHISFSLSLWSFDGVLIYEKPTCIHYKCFGVHHVDVCVQVGGWKENKGPTRWTNSHPNTDR
jgi:hypothetical protein